MIDNDRQLYGNQSLLALIFALYSPFTRVALGSNPQHSQKALGVRK